MHIRRYEAKTKRIHGREIDTVFNLKGLMFYDYTGRFVCERMRISACSEQRGYRYTSLSKPKVAFFVRQNKFDNSIGRSRRASRRNEIGALHSFTYWNQLGRSLGAHPHTRVQTAIRIRSCRICQNEPGIPRLHNETARTQYQIKRSCNPIPAQSQQQRRSPRCVPQPQRPTRPARS